MADLLERQQQQPVFASRAFPCLQQLKTTLPELPERLFAQIVAEAEVHHMIDFSVGGENTCSAMDFKELVALRDGDHGIHAGGQQSILDLNDVHDAVLPAARRSSQATS